MSRLVYLAAWWCLYVLAALLAYRLLRSTPARRLGVPDEGDVLPWDPWATQQLLDATPIARMLHDSRGATVAPRKGQNLVRTHFRHSGPSEASNA